MYCPANDLIWETFAWGAEAARQEGLAAEGAEQWGCALELSRTFPAGDPRHAASLDSFGVCLREGGDPVASVSMHREAVARWREAQDWVRSEMPVTLRVSSVSYHRGLQDRHRDKLANLSQHLQLRFCSAGLAAAQNNLACALMAVGSRAEEAQTLLKGACAPWMAAIGARDPGLAMINENLARVAQDAEAATIARDIRANSSTDRRARFVTECDPRITYQRRLLAAVYLSGGPAALSLHG